MHWLDYVVLTGYFLLMAGIGIACARRQQAQEDYFLGGRGFGKLLQTFAAFGAGTGSSDPVNAARTTFTGGLSGMWSVMYWLFVTPFYWFTAVWYRRMRHLTLGDWFVERYESRRLGAAYACFGILFYMVYGSMLFSAIGKVAAPLIGTGSVQVAGRAVGLEYILVPLIGGVVLIYGVLGGLRAAYWTDLIQGLCIILLSVLLIPFGLQALVAKFDPTSTGGAMDGFRILHEQVPAEYFTVVGSTSASEFPLHRIVAVVLINLVGIVVQPHFIATGGGSARNEWTARVSLVAGNFLKRLCTVGWAFTALLALAPLADSPELAADPDKTWGLASRALLGPGLTGLMLACLLAALMSSVDAYMIVGSALVVRNIYAPFVNPNASEKVYVRLARITGVVIVGGAVLISLFMMDVFGQLQLTWVVPVLFAAPFWIGIFWRRATTVAAWLTVFYSAAVFFVVPWLAPRVWPALRTAPALAVTNDLVETTVERTAAPADAARRRAAIALWEQQYGFPGGPTPSAPRRPAELAVGAPLTETTRTGGQAVFWSGGLQPVDAAGSPLADVVPRPVGPPQVRPGGSQVVVRRYAADVRLAGRGNLQLDYLLYQLAGMDLRRRSSAALATLSLPPKIVTPFLVMIVVSLLTRRNGRAALDRYYVKMRTPVVTDPEGDRRELELSYARPNRFEERKLLPGSDLEMLRPSLVDVGGFIVALALCFAIVGLAVWLANIGA